MRITIDTEKKELTFNGPLTIQEFMEFMNFIPTSETYLKVMEYTILPAKEEPTQTINKLVGASVTCDGIVVTEKPQCQDCRLELSN